MGKLQDASGLITVKLEPEIVKKIIEVLFLENSGGATGIPQMNNEELKIVTAEEIKILKKSLSRRAALGPNAVPAMLWEVLRRC